MEINCLCMNGENHELFNSHEDAKILKAERLMKAVKRPLTLASQRLLMTHSSPSTYWLTERFVPLGAVCGMTSICSDFLLPVVPTAGQFEILGL